MYNPSVAGVLQTENIVFAISLLETENVEFIFFKKHELLPPIIGVPGRMPIKSGRQ